MDGRWNENDQRNNLITSYIKFINLIKPKILFFENVKGFTLEFKKNKDKGKEYSTYVENELIKDGYSVKGELINFGDYGIPQKRNRSKARRIRRAMLKAKRTALRAVRGGGLIAINYCNNLL